MSSKQATLDPTDLWGLALGAVLFEMNGYDAANNYEIEPTEENLEAIRRSLKRGWGIESTEDLMNNLRWLQEEGHRTSFYEMRSFLSTLSMADQSAFLETLPKNTEKHMQYILVKAYMHKLPLAGIAAWDFGRYVDLCRMGAFVGYISEETSWELIRKVAVVAQESYSGWLEYGISYVAGRQFWLGTISEEKAKQHTDYVRSLVLNKDSLWRRLDWNLKLVDEEEAEEAAEAEEVEAEAVETVVVEKEEVEAEAVETVVVEKEELEAEAMETVVAETVEVQTEAVESEIAQAEPAEVTAKDAETEHIEVATEEAETETRQK
ncbi:MULTISPECIES: DUF1266 domain-containing protein [Brevibacillus]|jgi:Protein of unknown function (DUF1266)|uniref:DUF1266 domain-containing protein n=1 Tax=Brevibacillus TaxID=55080 RepID=UPI001C10DF7E|nr:DUF1266 domain-containing protein [Brevibacillus borstelensis]MCM3623659.1 DUF1266 domain-containing protein [Brevibacillus borstelensis]MED1744467.1 DUF1266 domain-containing protein [Brevibacillus borstelensis]